ncbi:MAG TPA: hypothetical protein VKY26_13120 [Actinomycetota bacterium]|nr:hypothetical protein [Actinomycetota bacterium]
MIDAVGLGITDAVLAGGEEAFGVFAVHADASEATSNAQTECLARINVLADPRG